MKKILGLFVATIALFAMWSCGDEEITEGGNPRLSLLSASIGQDEEVDPLSTTLVTLHYDAPVIIKSSASIMLNDRRVEARPGIKSASDVEIAVALEPNTAYTLVIPAGAILLKSDVKATAAPHTLRFRTGAYSYQPGQEVEDGPGIALRMARAMGWGWNLGNHFDTGANSDAAGNPIDFQKPKYGYWDGATPTRQLYQNLAAMGVGTVRIPVTWGVYQANDADYTIDADYMAEVERNVLWALDAGLYVVLNTHHDEYWQDIVTAVKDRERNAWIEDRLTKTWRQIANRFANCGNHLIFETMNEIHDESWGWKGGYDYKPVYAMMNEWNKVCVDAIRTTGGKNATRWIGIPGFCASPSFTLDQVTIPNGDSHIMIAVHCYDPFDFCTEGKTQQWGHWYKGNDRDERQIQDLFEKLNRKFVAHDIPCYMGEYGVVKRKASADEKYREYYLEYFTRCAYLNGIPPMLWDNNATSGEVFHFVNHNDGSFNEESEESLVRMMINAATSTDTGYTLKSIYDKAR